MPAGLRFSLQELSGGMGDLGTFMPLAVAMAASGHLDVPGALLSGNNRRPAAGPYITRG